jgi:hypothetical protein
MTEEKKETRLDFVHKKFEEMGYSIREDIAELLDQYPDIREKLEDTKARKITFFCDAEENSVGFTLPDAQVEFFLTTGEDDKGPWYEAEAEVRYF